MTQHVATFTLDDGRTYVSGLFWQPILAESKRDATAEVTSLADEMGFDLAIYRRGDTLQVGLGSSSEGIKPGYCSIAAIISKHLEVNGLPKDALIALPLPGGDSRWLYFACKDGVILSDGDIVGSGEKVNAILLEHRNQANWKLIVAPLMWRVSGSVEMSLDDFLPHDKKGRVAYHSWWQLRPVRVRTGDFLRRYSTPALVVIAAAALVGYGYKSYLGYQDRLKAEEIARSAAANAAVISSELPWHKLPRALSFAKACEKAINQLPLSPAGWEIEAMECRDDGSLMAVWKKPPFSTVGMLKDALNGVQFSRDGKVATFAGTLALPASSAEEVKALDGLLQRLLGQGQRLGIDVTLEDMPPPVVPEGTPPPVWRATKMGLTTSLPPGESVGWLEQEGLRLNRISLSFKEGSLIWKLEGTQYAQK